MVRNGLSRLCGDPRRADRGGGDGRDRRRQPAMAGPGADPPAALGVHEACGDTGAGPLLFATAGRPSAQPASARSEEHTSELQSLMRISYAVFCLKTKTIMFYSTSLI